MVLVTQHFLLFSFSVVRIAENVHLALRRDGQSGWALLPSSHKGLFRSATAQQIQLPLGFRPRVASVTCTAFQSLGEPLIMNPTLSMSFDAQLREIKLLQVASLHSLGECSVLLDLYKPGDHSPRCRGNSAQQTTSHVGAVNSPLEKN